jgi:hypothetical protein
MMIKKDHHMECYMHVRPMPPESELSTGGSSRVRVAGHSGAYLVVLDVVLDVVDAGGAAAWTTAT